MSDTRSKLRQQLLQARQAWSTTNAAVAAQDQLTQHLTDLLEQLEPTCLGLYWPIRGEFNPRPLALMLKGEMNLSLALPWAYKATAARDARMDYRRWDGQTPETTDECGIACPDSAPADPDVVLVPCVGYTASGHRLGYGGGYFDRYMAAHPHITAVGAAWDDARVDAADFQVQKHDQPLMLIVTPSGLASGD